MRPALFSAVLVSASALTAALDITSPTGKTLDVSGPITIAWTKPDPSNGDPKNYVAIQVRYDFYMEYSQRRDGADATGWYEIIAGNLTMARAGEVQWDPKMVREFLEETVADGRTDEAESAHVVISVDMMGREFRHGILPENTEPFSISGYEGGPEPGAGHAVRPSWVAVVVGAGALVQYLLL